MPLFGGFKANFRLLSLKKREDKGNIGEPICGAYRINREEFLTNNSDATKRNTTPVVQMTYIPNLKPSKSSNDIINDTSPNINNSVPTRQSMTDISQPKPVPRVKKNEREQKKLEKQAAEQRKKEIAEKKKREKQALQEQQRQEKIKKDREKQEKIDKAKPEKNKSKKRAAPQPVAESTPTIPQRQPRGPVNYSTNTLESSISRSSGPPPYSAEPDTVTNRNDNTGNTSFSPPPEDQGSWDIISQHREQLNRPKATAGYSKQTHMDLNYNVDLRNKDNSDA